MRWRWDSTGWRVVEVSQRDGLEIIFVRKYRNDSLRACCKTQQALLCMDQVSGFLVSSVDSPGNRYCSQMGISSLLRDTCSRIT